jgi:hypothetical protein
MIQCRLHDYIEDHRLKSFEELSQIIDRRRDKRALKQAQKRNKKLEDPNQTTLF